ncbi:MAG: hypothetical protein CVU56_13555 [Deltaproteobacteria bacterium HGW-Deltaproteobacteria-14]|jgi:hypothetical protein|nr:MAG: hypothetical protein CVU56_13555 [Deltaproteobacteria bacterium HGW-Deltaproteobacteria-14]
MQTAHSVLIVEDERIVARDLQQSLVALGYDAFAIASSSDEALARVTERQPDIVLMDIRIKGERDGIDTAALLRERFGTPSVYLTAHADDATIDRAKRTHPLGYLVKPIKTSELRSVIEVSLYRHDAEKRQRERERWFQTTLRSIADAVVTTDVNARVTFMNPMAEELTGWTREEAGAAPIDQVVELLSDGAPLTSSPLQRALAERQAVAGASMTLRSRDGTYRIVWDSAAPIIDDGRLLGAVTVFRDVSERCRLEAQVELSRRLASIAKMAAGVAHEVNNPLTVVMANLELARHQLRANAGAEPGGSGLASALHELIEDAAVASERIRVIVGDLRMLMRDPAPETVVADLSEVIAQAVHATEHERKGCAAVVVEAGELPLVAASELRLVQVFVNLLTNAAQAMPLGAPSAANQVRIAARPAGAGFVEVAVADTGSGMPPEVAARIFEPFFTTKGPGRGTGLGLFLCHGIVAAAGGTLSVESEPGVGTTFRMRLPTAAAPA